VVKERRSKEGEGKRKIRRESEREREKQIRRRRGRKTEKKAPTSSRFKSRFWSWWEKMRRIAGQRTAIYVAARD